MRFSLSLLTSKHKSFTTRRHIQESEIPWITRRHIWTGAMGMVCINIFMPTGLYFTYFALRYMSKAHIGILSSVVSMAVVFQLLSSLIERRYGGRKYPWFVLVGVSRLTLLPFLLFPGTTESALAPILIVLISFSSAAFVNLALPLWTSWVYGTIPERKAGIFWAIRERGVLTLTLVVMLLLGLFMDRAPDRLMVVRGAFALGIILGIMDIFLHVGIPEPPSIKTKKPSFFQELQLPLRNVHFRNWVIVVSFWTLSVSISGVFSVAYMLEDLALENFFINTLLIMVLPTLGAILFLRLWGKTTDSIGPRPVLLICHAFWASVPMWYMLAPRAARIISIPWPVIVSWFIVGAFVIGSFQVARQKVSTALAPPEYRTVFVAVLTIASMVAGGIGALMGSFLVGSFGIQRCFLVSLICRVAGVFPFAFIALAPPRGGSQANL